ncbi:MAG: ATPase domain-containing protein, partial [bacterium]
HRLPEPSKEKPTATGALENVPSGIAGFDDLLGGGYTRGTATVVAGLPGTYKTTLGLLFLLEGARNNEPGLHLTFNESPGFLTRVMEQKGMDLATHVASEKIKIWQFFPKSFYVDELLYRLEEEFAKGGTRRLVLDGTNELERSIENPDTYKDYIASLLALLARYNVTSVFLQKLDQLSGSAPLTNIRYSEMFDGIVYVAPVEIESAVHKMISVLKMRAGDFSSDLRELRCEKGGLSVTDKFVGMSGILAGNPQGQYKKTVEEVFQPVYFIRDFIELFTTPDLDPEQRRQMADSLKSETNKLVERLEDYFDIEK